MRFDRFPVVTLLAFAATSALLILLVPVHFSGGAVPPVPAVALVAVVVGLGTRLALRTR